MTIKMKFKSALSISAFWFLVMGAGVGAAEPDKSVKVRVAAYNVEFGSNASPEEIGRMFKPYDLDVIGLNEVPDGDWTARVGKVLGLQHTYVGQVSSANHKNKYKSILCRTPLEDTVEYELRAERRRSWNPASVIRAVTEVEGLSIALYSLHICASGKSDGHAYKLATEILPQEITERVILLGDFNNKIGDDAINAIEASGMRPIWQDIDIDPSGKYTYNALDFRKNHGVIDHIFFNMPSGACVTDGGIIELKKPLSDHKPVWAEIVFPQLKKHAK